MSIQRKNIAVCIILSIVTCGIYELYWIYCLVEDTNLVASRQDSAASGGMVLLLGIVTCGLYWLYWLYRAGEDLDRLRVDRGGLPGHLGLLYMLVALVGFSIVSHALLQSELNEYAAQ